METIDSIQLIISTSLRSFIMAVPNIIGGVIILAIGLVIAQLLRRVLASLFTFVQLDELLKRARVSSDSKQVRVWENILTEIIVWAAIISFLIPASEVWGLQKVSEVLNTLLFYLPNVIVAVIIGFIGMIFANLASDLVTQSVKTVGGQSSKTLAALARYAIMFFTALVVLNQLGVAQDLVRILFTGIIAMITIAGGLAFGLGGKDHAKELLDEMKKSMQ